MMNRCAKHHRRSIRLKGYDYARPGIYFVTICVQNRECLFGNVVQGEMQLNAAGEMVVRWFAQLENKFATVQCDASICMPNHVHFVVHNRGSSVDGIDVGADLRVCPVSNAHQRLLQPRRTHGSAPTGANDDGTGVGADLCVCPVPLSQIVQWFKTMTTNEYIRGIKQKDWPRFSGKLWQRNYWEHIVRDQSEWDRIRDYIHNNPAQWDQDRLNDRKTMVREPVCEYSGENWRV